MSLGPFHHNDFVSYKVFLSIYCCYVLTLLDSTNLRWRDYKPVDMSQVADKFLLGMGFGMVAISLVISSTQFFSKKFFLYSLTSLFYW